VLGIGDTLKPCANCPPLKRRTFWQSLRRLIPFGKPLERPTFWQAFEKPMTFGKGLKK